MTPQRILKAIVSRSVGLFGYEIAPKNNHAQREDGRYASFDMKGALERCARRGLPINTVIDIGASDGQWAFPALEILKPKRILMIEAQEPHKAALQIFVDKYPLAEYVIAAAGNREGEIFFDNGALFGGLASETPFAENCIRVPVVTVDIEVQNRQLPGPYLLKLDTHGFEVPILEGAIKTLEQCTYVIIEVYNFKLGDIALRFWEMCAYMANLGFYPIDLVDLMHKLDGALWQGDIVFANKNTGLFESVSHN